MLHQHNSCHLVKDIRTSVGLREAFQKRGLGKWLKPCKSYGCVSADRTNAAWTMSFSEKRAAVSLCRLFLCSRWNLPLRCWQSQMKLKVSWIGSLDMLSSLYSMSFPWGVSLPFSHVRFMLPNWAKLRFHFARCPISKHKTLVRLSILQKAISNQVQYAMYIPSYPQQDCFHYGFYQFKCLHAFRICGTPLHVQPALLKLDLNPIHPAFHNHSFPSGIHHDSGPHKISTLISWVSADISTASPFCKAGIFVSSSWVLHSMMCPMCPWVRNRLGWNILGSKAQFFSNFNWRLFTWSKPTRA